MSSPSLKSWVVSGRYFLLRVSAWVIDVPLKTTTQYEIIFLQLKKPILNTGRDNMHRFLPDGLNGFVVRLDLYTATIDILGKLESSRFLYYLCIIDLSVGERFRLAFLHTVTRHLNCACNVRVFCWSYYARQ